VTDKRVMKIVIFSAHPDDAETGAGGFCARALKTGHEVLIIHLSKEIRGRKIDNTPEAEIRVAEGKNAAQILGARVEFLDFSMGKFDVTVEISRVIDNLLRRNRPDIVLTHWPIDSHPDHQVAGILPIRSYVFHKKFCLGFYEVCTGTQTTDFQPNRYVNISDFVEQKNKSIFAHRSQSPELTVEMHNKMSIYRGLEMGCEHAEAFHILVGGQTNTAFDKLFDDIRVYGLSEGKSQFNFPVWEK